MVLYFVARNKSRNKSGNKLGCLVKILVVLQPMPIFLGNTICNLYFDKEVIGMIGGDWYENNKKCCFGGDNIEKYIEDKNLLDPKFKRILNDRKRITIIGSSKSITRYL